MRIRSGIIGVALLPASLTAFALSRLFVLPHQPWSNLGLLAAMWLLFCLSLPSVRRGRRRGGKPPRAAFGGRPLLLDTSVIIDGRIAEVVETRVFDAPLVVPQFVVAELQGIADSSDKLRRARGRRGLDVLNRLRQNAKHSLSIDDRELREYAGQPVDRKLVLLAKDLGAKVVTNDFNLNKVAQLHGVEVVNLNDVAAALRPTCLPGEQLTLEIVRAGEQPGQGVGYLDDGTMVVVEGGRDYTGRRVSITVTSVTQTSAGRMIFGKFDALVSSDQ